MSQQMIYMNLGIVVITIIAFIFFTQRAKMQASKDYAVKQRKKIHNKYSYYYNNVLIRKRFRRIVELYTSLSCYDEEMVKKQAVTLFERNAIIVIALPIVAMIVMRDVSIAILVAFVGMVYYEVMIEKEMDKIYIQLITDCSLVIGSIREKYQETDSVPLAVLYSDKTTNLQKPMDNIYRILTEVDGEERLEKFQNMYPIKLIRTLANVCYIVNENGAVVHEDNTNSFSDDMSIMRQECNAEIRRLTEQKIVFKSLQSLCLVGLIITPVMEWYMLSQIPGTAVLLKGFFGVCVHALTLGSTIFCFNYISSINRPSVVNQVDKIEFIDNLSKNRRVSRFITQITPRKYRTLHNINRRIRDALSSKDLRYIYTSKVVFAIGAFSLTMMLLVFGVFTVRGNFKNNYSSLSFIPQAMKENQMVQLRIMDDKFMKLSWEEYNEYDDETLTAMVKGSITGLSFTEAANQVKRLRTKYETYRNATFHWWFILISYVVAVGGWFMPEISLMMRKKLVQYEATDDIMQMQTLMIVLSETKLDVFKSLIWLEKQATIHRAPLRLAHYSYTADPEGALDILETMSPSNDFKRLTRKLKSAIYTLSLHDAFSDMTMDKSQSLAQRETYRRAELEERKNSAKLIAVIPAGLALVGSFIGPVLILGISELMEVLGSVGSI